MASKYTKIGLTALGLFILHKLRSNYQYNQIENEINFNKKIVLITGCDSGLGYVMALKLQQNGYRIVATCLQKQSVDNFNSNKFFTKNGSFAMLMDVTNFDHINKVKLTIKDYLIKHKDTIFWGIINNAGYYIPASFELVPVPMDMHNRNVLYLAPINLTKILLPLMHGRRNYKHKFNEANGGRIINISSGSVNFPLRMGQSYSSAKAGLSFWAKSLNMELSPKFGIWCVSVESGAYWTNIYKTGEGIVNNIEKNLIENKDKNEYAKELLDVYSFDELRDDWNRKQTKSIPRIAVTPVDVFIDDIMHGLSAKNPKRVYYPGWGRVFKILQYMPLSRLAKL
eukprot:226502_1